ncbi:MAG: hypothetical protein NT069_14230 [Planctomycetota bacterium]|nr:hypothetical protein [Planctomycetota bacterium]
MRAIFSGQREPAGGWPRPSRVDPTSGVVGYGLTDNTWFDASGNVIKSQPAGSSAFTKTTYDGLGRTLNTYVGYDLSDSTYIDATTITGDSIFQQTEQTYDAASNVIQTTARARYHSATGTGSLGSPSSTQPKARVTYVAPYPDALGRTVAVADYGTNGGTALSRSGTIPTRSDTCLVTSMTFDVAGNQATTTDPAGLVVQMTFDALGRETQQVKNPVTSSSSSSSSSSNTCGASDDTNVTVQTSYTADGQIATITAVNSNTGNQITQYVYGTTLSDSAIATSNLKRSEVYPDSVDSDDSIKFTYNRQGKVTTKTDQNGTVHSYDFDKLGRGTEGRVTTLASGVDGAVLRIEKTFEVRGMVQHITSYDNATVGSGAIVNDVLFAYNSFGQVTADYQSHSGAVNVASTPKVQYAYLSGSANSIRPTSMTYPNGRVLTYSNGTAGGANDALSRISALVDNDGTTQLAAYQYLGLGAFVEVDYTQPDVKYTLIDLSSTNDPDTGDIYSGLDRFSRVKDCRWYNYGTSTDAVRIKHGYDRAGNRLYREDPVAASYGKAFDELYAYDATNRLRDMQRGTLNGSKTAITGGTKTFEQCWTLDATGNWQGFREDSDGNSSWDLVQARSDNKVNEITGVTNAVGSAWVGPAYNRAGNMTTVPQPADPTKGYTATYDAWNRFVKLVDASNSQTVQENAYDGRMFRTVRKSYTGGVLSETRHYLYTTAWQVAEERTGTSTSAERQLVWGLRYIDDLILRDRDDTGTGTLHERLNALQDANWNVVAIAYSAGAVQERYAYSAYGAVRLLSSTYNPSPTSIIRWGSLYCGYAFDLDTSLAIVRYRFFSTGVGWLMRDPVLTKKTGSLFEYAMSLPLSRTDPSGLDPTIIPPYTPTRQPKPKPRGLSLPSVEDFAKSQCKADCIGAACAKLFQQGEIGRIAHAAADFGQRVADSFEADESTNINISIRHCVAAARLARELGCRCSKCLGHAREQLQYYEHLSGHAGNTLGQARRGDYRNRIGRKVLGCWGVDYDLDCIPIGKGCVPLRLDSTTDEQIIQGCKAAWDNGLLDPTDKDSEWPKMNENVNDWLS